MKGCGRWIPAALLGLLAWFPLALAAKVAGAGQAASVDERVAAAEKVVAAEARRVLDAGAASVSVALLLDQEVVSASAFGQANVRRATSI